MTAGGRGQLTMTWWASLLTETWVMARAGMPSMYVPGLRRARSLTAWNACRLSSNSMGSPFTGLQHKRRHVRVGQSKIIHIE